MQGWIVAMLLLAGGGAQAQQVIWKCTDAKGALAYRSGPCVAGERELGTRTYEAAPDRPQALAERRRIEAEMERRGRTEHSRAASYRRASRSAPTERDVRKAHCKQARQSRDGAIRRGAQRAQRDALERSVIDACFGL